MLYSRYRKKPLIAIVAWVVFLCAMMVFGIGTAQARSIDDVITEIGNSYLTKLNVESNPVDMDGYQYVTHVASGDMGEAGCFISVAGPMNAEAMKASLSESAYFWESDGVKTTPINGYEVFEFQSRLGAGVDVLLPQYKVGVTIVHSGNGRAWELEKARSIAKSTIESLKLNGVLNQTAPQEETAPVTEPDAKPETETNTITSSDALTGEPLDEPVSVCNTDNIAWVDNGPTVPNTFSINTPHLVTYIRNYHWNYAQGATPGTIALQDQNGKIYGPWQASGSDGQGGVHNANWEVSPNVVIPAGTYTVIDSDPSTWATNAGTGGKGMGQVHATPHFTVASELGEDSADTRAPESSPWRGSSGATPAGVGSVGAIPGPSNTTEAVVGVVAPGLIATILGAMAGLGGGGGGFTPPPGTTVPPAAGGPAPTTGSSYPGANAQSNASFQEVGQLGRRRRDAGPTSLATEPAPGAGDLSMTTGELTTRPEVDDEPSIFIDTVDMIDGSGAIINGGQSTPTVNDLFIETAEENAVLTRPDAGMIIETAAESDVFIQRNTGAIIDTAGEAAVLIQDGRVAQPDITWADSSDDGILLDTSAFDEPARTEVASLSQQAETAQYDEQGFDAQGYDRSGYDKAGFDREGINKDGFDKEGYDLEGFNKEGFNREGFNKEGYNEEGIDRDGFNKAGYDKNGFDKEGFDKDGFDQEGFNREGFDKQGFDREGFNKEGFNEEGFDRDGFNKAGYDKNGFDKEGFDKEGFDKDGFNQKGFNREGFDKQGFDREGFNKEGFNKEGFNKEGFNEEGFDRDGFNKAGYDKNGFDKEGFDKDGFDQEGFNREGFDKQGFDREGFNKEGFNEEGFDREGFNKDGFDRDGYGKNGFDREGYNREGYDVNGYDRKGYNRSGFDAKGYDRQGYDKEGFNKEGWDRDGYGRNGLNKDGYDREGYDKAGYDKDGYDRDGYDREGRQREGYDADGYDKDGFNKNGYDRDGYDREGFDYEGYNRGGYDPWGFDKQGYGKDGYHWSGYNGDGYNRAGLHWTDNPYEGDSPFNVRTGTNPFDEDLVVDLGGHSPAESWKPTKPPLGEPYPRTVEKYGPKPWTDEIPQPEPEKPAIPTTGDTGVIGPEDPMNTLKNHELDKSAPATPEGQDGTELPVPEEDIPETQPDGQDIPEQQVETGDSDTFTYTDPDTGETSTYEYEKGYNGPRHGDTQILVGKSDEQTYELEFDAVKGKWINTESGNEFNPDDFDRWQNDLAEDRRRAAIDLEKMAKREDANSKAIDKNLEDWKKLEQMQKVADKYNIGEPGGPGDVDKAIEDLKKDMLDGKQLDQEKMDKIRRVIDNRILGRTTADTGERWEEDWFKNLGWALEANAATAKEVVTGEKADGSISWLGMAARIMITAATGGGASMATTFAGEITRQGIMDGALTVAEALYRIKDSIDKGESDFRAVSKAIGMVILGEEIGWLAGQAGGKFMGEMLERFPAFTNKAADLIEKLALTTMAADQLVSRYIGLAGKEAAEETIDQINKRLVDLGSDTAVEYIQKSSKAVGLVVSDSFDDISKGIGKAASGSGDDIARKLGRAASGSGDDIATSAGRAASGSGDDLAKGTGKATSGSDDMGAGAGKAASRSDDMAKGTTGTTDGPKAPDGPGGPARTGDGGGDGPGDPGGRAPAGGDAGGPQDDIIIDRPINPNARTPEEVLADPATVARAENTVQNNIDDFDKLSPARQQELIGEQAIYDEYRMQAQERNYNLADKVQRREPLTVQDIMEMKADPASMRTLKNLEHTEGIGAELGEFRSHQVQSEFNEVLETQIHQPSYRAVEDHLNARYNGAQIRCNTVRTPGTEHTPWNINTDNDVIAERLVIRPDGTTEWVEIPKSEWEDVYYEAFARNSSFSVDEAAHRFPSRDWANMDDAARYREWANLHEEAPMDVFDPMGARDFSNQRTAILNGERPCGPLFDRDGNLLRDPIDAEQLGMMEKHKANDYWDKGDTPAEIMRNQTESLEQLRKTANVVRNLEGGTHNMPPNMQEAIRVINNNNLSPALRGARLRELGYDTPGDLVEKLTSRIGSFRAGNR
ncbi:hypothetical protein SPSYN_00394 [Sporotomaculum syntrophicum]|uniref:Uncharacterized protein n=1 Tax=Sporotomaculum syntrophicum TaxID=182264 RepID=A0A9D2WT71_9FIRM|nr:hypothetical protein [Sporotomaculum syntrophicum]KAF1086675.1 hypothetical protein SPSYN_00394 [Sporotomaculum syntrophicum]